MESTKEGGGLAALKWSVGLYLVMFAAKLGVYFVTGVMALLAEALHTLSDIFVSGFLLIAAVISRRRADDEHQFGHGRAQYAGAMVASTLFISFTSLELYREAIPALIKGHRAEHQNISLALGILVVSAVITAGPLVKLIFTRNKGAALKAQFVELINDELGLLAAIIGTLLVMRGVWWADAAASLAVATIIAVNGVKLFRENLSYLMGQSPGKPFLDALQKAACAVKGVKGVHDIQAQILGEDSIQALVHLEVDRGITIDQAHGIMHSVSETVHGQFPGLQCTISPQPARPRNEG